MISIANRSLLIAAATAATLGLATSVATAGPADKAADSGAEKARPEATIGGKGSIRKVSYKTSDDDTTTDSRSYVNVPGMKNTFRANGPVVIVFCAEAYTSRTDPDDLPAMFVQATLNGTPVAPSSAAQNVTFEGNQPAHPTVWRTARCFQWATHASGKQDLRIQYRLNGGVDGDFVGLDDKSVTVMWGR
ncbi:hypothetical protein [Microbaculum marinum]|uniref:Secreted protein n=1 Tax=Microbaculum marinum TaxID=1764581 RepID=A0AAW9RVL7_9HYPH